MKRFARALAAVTVCVGLFLGWAGCDNTEEDPALLRVIHATPDLNAIDFFIDFELLTRNLAFRNGSPYLRWDPGLRRLEARAADDQRSLLTQDVVIDAGAPYTFVVTGAANAASLLVLEDDRSTPPDGQARLRVVHAAPGISGLNVLVREENGPATIDVNLSGPGETSAFFSVDAAAYTVEARALSGGGAPAVITQTLDSRVRYLLVVTNTAVFLVADG